MLKGKDIVKYYEKITKDGKKRLLIHACCGPCSSSTLVFLHDYFDIKVVFYNPNIYPEAEYNMRLDTIKKLIAQLDFPVEFMEIDYDHSVYLEEVKSLESEPEGGKRCHVCYAFRLEEAAKIAASEGFDYFTTTLSVSPYKNSRVLNEIGDRLGKKYQVNYLYSDFKKNEGYKESIRLSKLYDLYRQDYCGCEMSKRDLDEKKTNESN